MKTGINKRIAELFEEHAINAKKLGEIIGVTPQSVNRWPKTGEVKDENLEKLLNFFKDISRDWLYFGTGPKRKPVLYNNELVGNYLAEPCQNCMKKDGKIEQLKEQLAEKETLIDVLKGLGNSTSKAG